MDPISETAQFPAVGRFHPVCPVQYHAFILKLPSCLSLCIVRQCVCFMYQISGDRMVVAGVEVP